MNGAAARCIASCIAGEILFFGQGTLQQRRRGAEKRPEDPLPIHSSCPAFPLRLRASAGETFLVAARGCSRLVSHFGTYELARFTLPDGLGVWGPTWCHVALA